MKDKEADLTKEDITTLNAYKGSLDAATKFIPFWVKLAVAIALGLGTMIGWKRIVVTVGEKIGKTHLSYGQGAAAELVAAGTIFAAAITACRCRPLTCSRRASPAPWRRTAPACRCRPCGISRSLGCSPYHRR
jgi:Phosphate transporter family